MNKGLELVHVLSIFQKHLEAAPLYFQRTYFLWDSRLNTELTQEWACFAIRNAESPLRLRFSAALNTHYKGPEVKLILFHSFILNYFQILQSVRQLLGRTSRMPHTQSSGLALLPDSQHTLKQSLLKLQKQKTCEGRGKRQVKGKKTAQNTHHSLVFYF